MSARMFPPPVGTTTTTVHGGRTYTGTAGGTPVEAQDCDVFTLTANGWTKVANYCGVTTARQANAWRGMTHYDDTLNFIVVFDGVNWRNPSTGALA